MALPGGHMTQLIPSVAASMPSPRWRCGSWPYGPRSGTRAQRKAPQGSSTRIGAALTSKAWPRARWRGGGSAPVGLLGAIRRSRPRPWRRSETGCGIGAGTPYRGRKSPIGVDNLPTPMTHCLPQCWFAAARARRHRRTAVAHLGKPACAPAQGLIRACCCREQGPAPTCARSRPLTPPYRSPASGNRSVPQSWP